MFTCPLIRVVDTILPSAAARFKMGLLAAYPASAATGIRSSSWIIDPSVSNRLLICCRINSRTSKIEVGTLACTDHTIVEITACKRGDAQLIACALMLKYRFRWRLERVLYTTSVKKNLTRQFSKFRECTDTYL